MSDHDNDEDLVELTPDLIADGQEGGEEPKSAATPSRPPRPPPGNPFTLLAEPRTEEERREERRSSSPTEQQPRAFFVPEARGDAVKAVPIRRLGDASAPTAGEGALPSGAADEEPPVLEADDESTAGSGSEQPPAVEPVAADEEPEGELEDEEDDEILDLGQEYVVDGQAGAVEAEADSPVPESRPPEQPPADAGPEAPAARPEDAGGAEEGAAAHPFDFGTPEMVFDRVADSEEEEVDESDLEEEPEPAPAEPEGEEIDLAEAMEVSPPPVPAPPAVPVAPGRSAPRRRGRRSKREWWASIFDDDFLAVMPAYSKRDLRRELNLIEDNLGVEPGRLVLDLACGAGRHAIGMARRNYRVVGVDLSLSMLARAGELAQEADQRINFIHGDMRDLGFDQTFDGIYCVGTSFGYFDDQVNVRVIEGVHRALKPGGSFLLEIANRDHAITKQPNLLWFEMNDVVSMEETDFNYINSRLHVSRQIILDGGQRQAKHEYSVRLYSLHEIGQILHNSGFAVTRVSGHASSPGAFFGVDSQKLIIVAQRRR